MKQKERRKELLPFTLAWMELDSIILREISPSSESKYHMISMYKWNLTNKANKRAK